ncbi:MAG: hypothetical protein LUH63_14460 [Parabacteroides sp.]|nr:hypothetical protein [Parabacteroides sp.]
MNKQLEDIKAIREMMERSSKFLSLSGLSGITAGLAAIIGAFVADFYILTPAIPWQALTKTQCIHCSFYWRMPASSC